MLAFGSLQTNWNQWFSNRKFDTIILFSEENVFNLWGEAVIEQLSLVDAECVVVPEGEDTKSFDIVYQVLETLTEYEISRNALWVNLGGGMVSDLGGFIASIYKRGIAFVNIPTSLLAQVDASVGGKTGVNFQGLKNHVGVFANPEQVFIDTQFLETLQPNELVSGYGEVVKHALIHGLEMWEMVINHPLDSWTQTEIEAVVAVKSKVVEEDPREKGLRKVLNLGHTIGHAIESWSHQNDPLPHGACVLLGLWAECYVLQEKGVSQVLIADLEMLVKRHINTAFLKSCQAPDLLKWMTHDKKNEGKDIHFALAKKPGDWELGVTLEKDRIEEKLNTWLKELNP